MASHATSNDYVEVEDRPVYWVRDGMIITDFTQFPLPEQKMGRREFEAFVMRKSKEHQDAWTRGEQPPA